MNIGITLRWESREDKRPFSEYRKIPEHFISMAERFNINLIPICTENAVNELASICSGLVVTGSAINGNPSYYGEDKVILDNPVDEYKLDSKIIREFSENNKPILGICGGMQEVNVCFGGTLKRDIDGHYRVEHNIRVLRDIKVSKGFIGDVFNKDIVTINSFHHQAVDKIADGFIPVAISETDGIIEAIENADKHIICVQWHPEVEINNEYDKLFGGFFEICAILAHDIVYLDSK